MEEIDHFSHKQHALKLIENRDTVEETVADVISCEACQEPVSISSGEPAYGCIPCNYFLHKTCAQLPSTFTHQIHPFHTLALIQVPVPSFWGCDVCNNIHLLKGFGYDCKLCPFISCIKCVVVAIADDAAAISLKKEASVKLKHDGHNSQHSLTLQIRSGTFPCDACRIEEKDLLYICDDCDFWIHKTCAHLPATIELNSHHPQHPLALVYSLPDNFYNYSYFCDFCEKYIQRSDWLYHCANCRFFAHIKCALNADKFPTPRGGQEYVVESDTKDLLHFPMWDAFTDPLKLRNSTRMAQDGSGGVGNSSELLDSKKIARDDESINEINHRIHDHPLILNDESQGNNNINLGHLIEVCHCCCVRPLSFPYYSCTKDGCSFVLHKYCFELPVTLQCHQLHPEHPLNLVPVKSGQIWRCDGCYSWSNTFVYQCKICKFRLDVNCAFLPNTIKHISHHHPLIQVIDIKLRCRACDLYSDNINYACKECDFHLDLYCAIRSPILVGHRYCKGHKIPLTYPPVEDHPEDFYCDICEEEMHPKFPLYHCHPCKNSFHIYCMDKRFNSNHENICCNVTITVTFHKHPLTYVRRKKTPNYICCECNGDINGYLVLECQKEVCNYNICYDCCK